MNFHPELINAIKENRLVVFVGAGLSYDLRNRSGKKIGGWTDLVRGIINDLKQKGYEVDHLIPLLEKVEPIEILRLIEKDEKLPKNEIADFSKEYLNINDKNDLEAHKLIGQITSQIVTTNYDLAIENAIPELKLNTAYRGKTFELQKHIKADQHFLFKLHGCIGSIDSMVLFPSQYDGLYASGVLDSNRALAALKNLIYNRNVLFIGSGMGDFQINNFFKTIEQLQGPYNQRHFIVSTKELDSELSFLTLVKVNEYSQIKNVLKELVKVKMEHQKKLKSETDLLRAKLEKAETDLETLNKEYQSAANELDRKDKLLKIGSVRSFRLGINLTLENSYLLASVQFQTAILLDKENAEAFFMRGHCQSKIAESEIDPGTSLSLRTSAVENFIMAEELGYKTYDSLATHALTKGKLAESYGSKILYEEALSKFEESLELKPDYRLSIHSKGVLFSKLAYLEDEPGKRQSLFERAFTNLENGINLDPSNPESFCYLGMVKSDYAQDFSGMNANLLQERLIKAIDLLYRAIELKPDYAQAYNSCGLAFGNLWLVTKDPEQLTESKRLMNMAISLGGKSNNMAWIMAVSEDKENAIKYLEESINEGSLTRENVQGKWYWTQFKDDQKFKAILSIE